MIAATGKLTIDPLRAEAFEENLKHYSEIFTNGNSRTMRSSKTLNLIR